MCAATDNASGRPCRWCACPGSRAPAADFEALAQALSSDAQQPRAVFALDYRGRGQSDYDRDVSHYSFQTELADVLAVIAALDCMPAVFVGTSRGGILAMLLAAARPSAIAGCVLNDIGPVIEPQGLMRIKGYVGKLPQPRDFEDGAEILRRLFSGQFPKLGHDDWLAAAHRTFKQNGWTRWCRPTMCVLPRRSRASISSSRLPALWKEFDALGAAAADGDPRRQFRPAVAADRHRHARAPPRDGDDRSARPGPRAAIGGAGHHRAHFRFRRRLR